MKATKSSAYREMRCLMDDDHKGERMFIMFASLNNALSDSMTITNSSSESGSPCLRPLAWQIHWLGFPFKRILVLAVERMMEIQLTNT
jgi:hypothetical protein